MTGSKKDRDSDFVFRAAESQNGFACDPFFGHVSTEW